MANGNAKNRPAHTVRVGRCKVTIWCNETKKDETKRDGSVMYSAVPTRIFRRDNGEWEETHSLSGTEILLMKKALDRAFDWIVAQEQQQSE